MKHFYKLKINPYYLLILIWIGAKGIHAQEYNALNFEGPANSTYDYIEVADNSDLDFTTAFTFETYVNFDNITRFTNGWDWQCFFVKSRYNESYGLMLLTEGQKTLRFYHAGFGTGFTDYSWTSSLTANTWYHVAVTFNGTKTAIYINGVEVASQTAAAGSVVPNDNSLMIGANRTTGGDPYPLQATLEETRLWKVARTETEINSTMNTELVGNETGLVLYYKYNQGIDAGDNTSITEVVDSSINGYNGTLNAFALNSNVSNFIDKRDTQSITFNPLTPVVYGDAGFNLNASSSSNLEVSYISSDPSVATVSGNAITIVGAGTTTITASQAGNVLYKPATDMQQNLTVNALAIEVTADAKTKYEGASDPALTYAITSGALVNGDVFSGNLTRASGETVGSYAINQGTVDNANYDITFVSNDLTILSATTSIWDGSTNSLWTEATNWSGDLVPTSASNVTIPNVTTLPTIGAGTNIEINQLTINASASLEVNGNGGVVVNGDFTNNGSVKVTATATNSSALIVKGTSSGMVTYERGGLTANKWSIVTAPVTGQSIKDFVENIANDIRINTASTPNRYAVGYYDDSRATGTKWVYYTVDDLASNSLTFEKGRSYAISRATDGAVTFTGTLETTNVAKSVAVSEWNAVGNPYTAFLPINANGGSNFITDNTSKLDPAYVGAYVWDNTQNKYIVKSLVTSDAALAPGQGFFVKTTSGANTVNFNEAQRSSQPALGGDFSRTQNKLPGIKLSVTNSKRTVSTELKYLESTTVGLDPGYDLGNHSGASFDVFTRLATQPKGIDFTIQSLPIPTAGTVIIPVGIKAALGKEVKLLIEANSLPTNTKVFVEDKLLNTFTELKGTSYQTNVVKKQKGTNRFYLHLKTTADTTINTTDVKVYNTNTNLIIKGVNQGAMQVEMYSTTGRRVFVKAVEAIGNNSIELPSLHTGIYLVKVTSELGEENKKIIIK